MHGPARTIGLIGARGYTGVELMSLLGQHDGFELVLASSRAHSGHAVRDQVPGFEGGLTFSDCSPAELAGLNLDVVVLALPNGISAGWVQALNEAGYAGVIVDISADHRFDDTWYYGLPELTRANAEGRRRISNPGCYATAMQLALAPVRDLLDGTPHCFGISGYSGAGTQPSEKNDPERLANNILPYKPLGHVHEREVSRHIDHAVRFMPHVASFFRGISMTVTARLAHPAGLDEVRTLYAMRYRDEPLVRLSDDIPTVADNVGMHHACIGGWQLGDDGHELVVFATLDNLLKGAATQALQNINLACGYDEFAGIVYG